MWVEKFYEEITSKGLAILGSSGKSTGRGG